MAEDDITDSWEDLEDSGELDKRLSAIGPTSKTKVAKKQNGNAVGGQSLQEQSDRTSYQPQVRILKRQPKESSQQSQANKTSSKPTKTLAEREAAYAEARQRILGSTSTNSNAADMANSADERPPRIIQQLDGMRLSENVVRQPRGPDGSQGFNSQNLSSGDR